MWGAYVHVPWCRARCPYCAFAVEPLRGEPPWRPFVDRVLRELDQRRSAFPGRPQTAFFGGGTPSRLPPRALGRVIAALAPAGEVTAEVNPEDLDEAWVAGALAAGVTRLSLGVQSFDPAVAGRLGRAHTRRRAAAAIALVRASGVPTFSIDLIFAVPGQTLAQLDADLDHVVGEGVPHVSVYGLTIEDGTRFARARARGALPAGDDDAWRAMYDRLVARLHGAGVERYEVSNFARPGHRSAHNRLYWTDAPYLGLGPSAHGYAPDGARWANVRALADYLAAADPTETAERPDARTRATDLVVSSIRAVEGLDEGHLTARTGLAFDAREVGRLIHAGLVSRDGGRLALTELGFPVCDGVAARLVDALVDAAPAAVVAQ